MTGTFALRAKAGGPPADKNKPAGSIMAPAGLL